MMEMTKLSALAIYPLIMNNEVSSEKKWFNVLINSIKRREAENIPVRFRIEDITARGFRVKVGGLYAYLPFYCMPWRYKNPSFWNIIFPSIVGKHFMGKVSYFNENPLTIRVNTDSSLFPHAPFKFETNEISTGIILEKTNTTLQIDFGYEFGWKRGSLIFKITRNSEEKDVDLFPQYNQGEEFDAVYIGKSAAGNDIFCYEDGSYFSEEHNLIGRKVWAKLERTESDFLCFQIDEKYAGELLLDKKDDLGISHELLQKTLQTLPDEQRLQCKVMDVTPNGTLQLKWLVDIAPDAEDVLSVHHDTSIFNLNDSFLSEKQKALINKNVWCEVSNSSYPKIFKIENLYTGTISMNATDYPDIPLNLIINTLSEFPIFQKILCKIKGIYPDETLKLQWSVQRDSRSQKLVFPTVFSQKITLEEKAKKIDKPKGATKEQMTEQPIEKITDTAPINQWIGKKIQPFSIKKYVGKTLLAETQKDENGEIVFRIDDQYIGRIITAKSSYPGVSCEAIISMLHEVPIGQPLLCIAQKILSDLSIGLRWMIDDDPFADKLLRKYLTEIERETIIKKQMTEQYIGKTFLFEAQKDENSEPVFRISDKYIGRIIVPKYPEISHELITNTLREVPIGQCLLCKVHEILPDLSMRLIWLMNDDPFAGELLRKLSKVGEPEKPLRRGGKTVQKCLKASNQLIEGKLMGQTVQAKIINFRGSEPYCLINDKYNGYLSVASHLYHGLSRDTIKNKFQHFFEKDEYITCQVIGVRPDNHLRLKWMMTS